MIVKTARVHIADPYHHPMFSGKGLRRRVEQAVQAAVEAGETVQGYVYLHVYGNPIMAILTGLPINITTWIAARTDRRVLFFHGAALNAAKSELLASYPLAEVAVTTDHPDKPTKLSLLIAGQTATFSVPLIWRSDAARFADGLASA